MATTQQAVSGESLLTQATELEGTLEQQNLTCSDSEVKGGRGSLSRDWQRRHVWSWGREPNMNQERGEGPSKDWDGWLQLQETLSEEEPNDMKTLQIAGRSEKSLINLHKAREILLDSNTKHLSETKQLADDEGDEVELADNSSLTRVKATRKQKTLPAEDPDPRQQREILVTTQKDGFAYEREADANTDEEERENGSCKVKGENQTCLQQGGSKGCKEACSPEQDESKEKLGQRGEDIGCGSHLRAPKGSCAAERSSFRCWHCNQSFPSSFDLLAHERIHMGEKLYRCFRCGERIRIDAGQNRYDCLHCGFNFRDDSKEGRKRYKCLECGRSFNGRTALRSHESIHSDRLYICTLCGELIRSWSRFNVHVAGHGIEDPSKL